MNDIILKAENISKQYRLGLVGTGTIAHDLNRWWHLVRGKEDPYMTVGDVNDRSEAADSDYVWALKDINFEVKRGEVLGIIGKNGAGKSTLLKILSKVTGPTTGIIRSKGRIASLLEVGTGFHGELTGRENIYLNGAILGMTKAEIASKIDEIVDFSGCTRYIDTPVKRYSSGMMVRLGFAVAAHLEPDILIVDEVLAVGDIEFQKKAIGKMKDISSGQGRTVLFVSHNMDSVRNLCTRGFVLENGLITFSGTQNESVDYYLSLARENISDVKSFESLGNDFISVHSVTVNEGKKYIGIEDDVDITVEFTLLQPTSKRVDVAAAISNESDLLMLNTGTGLSSTSPIKNEVGLRQKLEMKILSPNLNSGLYSVTLRFVENRAGQAKLRLDEIITFEVRGEKLGEAYIKTAGVISPTSIIKMQP
ncbi:polysaccharide ABC transporter ATP-binding protein [Sungkyunkwania multivorans]|uniref:Polysaccharide ABC transporter ATP-binding protein n=1 Tax=Sungkyunkwania multivorans TaxID=1173618 RepID=A0ABW3D2N4_9FLAO